MCIEKQNALSSASCFIPPIRLLEKFGLNFKCAADATTFLKISEFGWIFLKTVKLSRLLTILKISCQQSQVVSGYCSVAPIISKFFETAEQFVFFFELDHSSSSKIPELNSLQSPSSMVWLFVFGED